MKHLLTIVKILVTFILLAYIFLRIGIVETITTLSQINPLYLTMTYGVLVILIVTNTLNLKILLSPLHHFRFLRLLNIYSRSWSIGFLTPGKLGELSIIYFLGDVSRGKAAAVIVLEKMLTLIILVALSLIGIFILGDVLPFAYVFVVVVSIVGGTSLLFSSFGRQMIKRVLLRNRVTMFEGFSATLSSYVKTKKRYLMSSIFFIGVRWILFTVMASLLFVGLGQNVPFVTVLMIVSASSLISMIPISISGLGIREGSFILLSSSVGIPVTISAGVSLLSLIVSYSTVFVIFMIQLKGFDMSLEKINAAQHQKAVDSV